MIITRSPLRICLGGGGTDLPSYYRQHTGFVISAAISRYVYITINEAFRPRIIVKYSKFEDVERVEEMMEFYRDVLGFRLSDYFLRPYQLYFFHVNPRHHSIAFLETGRNGLHHLMMELFSLDDVGQAYDLALGEEGRIGVTLGRHTNDAMTSFYSWTPSGFLVEYGWGGRSIEPATWQPGEVEYGPSLWGHDRVWLGPDARAKAREMRLAAAADGLRLPVNVIRGNYELAPGVCPWWDDQVRSARRG